MRMDMYEQYGIGSDVVDLVFNALDACYVLQPKWTSLADVEERLSEYEGVPKSIWSGQVKKALTVLVVQERAKPRTMYGRNYWMPNPDLQVSKVMKEKI